MNNTKALEAQSRINQAQEDEAKARKAGNPLAVDEAVARKTRAEDDLYAALQLRRPTARARGDGDALGPEPRGQP